MRRLNVRAGKREWLIISYGIAAVFLNPDCRDCVRLNPGI